MLNCVGQDVGPGDYVVQIARTNQGMVKRAGVVLGYVDVEGTLRLRTAWYDRDEAETSATESVVGHENLIKIDWESLPQIVAKVLGYAKIRGRAAL